MSRGGARVWGNAHPAAQLTERKVIRYRELVRSGKATVGELAAREGCSHGRISMAVRGETWQHLNAVAPPVPSSRPRAAAAPPATARSKAAAAKRTAAKRAPAKRAPAKQAPAKRAPAKAAKRAAAKSAARKTVRKAARTVAKKTAAKAAARRR